MSTEHLNKITEVLMQKACSNSSGSSERCFFSDEEIGLLMGKNSWNLIKRVLPETSKKSDGLIFRS